MDLAAVDDFDLLPAQDGASPTLRRIQSVATVLFAERGYDGVSIRDIAGAVGISSSALYTHYASKEDLFTELVVLAKTLVRDAVRKAALNGGPGPEQQLRAVVRAYVTFHATYPLLASIGHHDMHMLSEESIRRATDVIHDIWETARLIVERGRQEGVFAVDRPVLALTAIAALGSRVAYWYRPPGYRNRTAADRYPRLLLEGRDDLSVDELADEYADYAVAILRSSSADGFGRR